jgi:hypothetical protein
MTPKLTQAMLDDAIKDGAEVKEKRKVQRPSPPVTPIPPDNSAELQALRDENSKLRGDLEKMAIDVERRVQELTVMLQAMSEMKPMRVKPIRDMDRDSKTYLLVTHYDFVPVSYQRKLDS